MPNVALIPEAASQIAPLMAFVDGFDDDEHTLETATGTEPLEDGTEITDHAVARQEKVRLTGHVSDWGPPTSIGVAPPGRVRDAWEEIRRLHKEVAVVELVTELGVYPNMIIRRVKSHRDGRGMMFVMELEQVIRVEIGESDIRNVEPESPAGGRVGGTGKGRVHPDPAAATEWLYGQLHATSPFKPDGLTDQEWYDLLGYDPPAEDYFDGNPYFDFANEVLSVTIDGVLLTEENVRTIIGAERAGIALPEELDDLKNRSRLTTVYPITGPGQYVLTNGQDVAVSVGPGGVYQTNGVPVYDPRDSSRPANFITAGQMHDLYGNFVNDNGDPISIVTPTVPDDPDPPDYDDINYQLEQAYSDSITREVVSGAGTIVYKAVNVGPGSPGVPVQGANTVTNYAPYRPGSGPPREVPNRPYASPGPSYEDTSAQLEAAYTDFSEGTEPPAPQLGPDGAPEPHYQRTVPRPYQPSAFGVPPIQGPPLSPPGPVQGPPNPRDDYTSTRDVIFGR